MSIFNPYVMLGALLAVLSAFATGYMKGESDEFARQQTEIAALNAKARDTEQAMAKVAQTYGETLRKANHVAKIKETRLRADISTGAFSLRIPVKTPQCVFPMPETATPASGSDAGTTSAELDRTTADALLAIAAEGDAAIRKLNTCIQAYEQMKGMQ